MNLDQRFLSFFQKRDSSVSPKSIQAVLTLRTEGSTVPFIARYRKEKTGNLDEVQIRSIFDSFDEWGELVKRKEYILSEIEKQGNLTEDLKARIEACADLGELEEIYRPYKKKKKTKATIAREAGIGPFADWIWGLGQGEISDSTTLEVKAKEFINATAGFAMYEEVLQGAQNILVEKISNNPELRLAVRKEFETHGKITSQKTTEFKSHSKFEMYANFTESVKSLESPKSSHRYLALRRGWQEGELKVSMETDLEGLTRQFDAYACPKEGSQATSFLKTCAKTALTVHVIPSITNEIHTKLKDQADLAAILVFAENVKRVLMSSPFGAKVVLGVDPGIRTGCKVALIDNGGNFISHTVVHIQGAEEKLKAKKLFEEVVKQIKIESIAVGNGTGGRETETFFRSLMKELGVDVPVLMVNESGASVYSASDVAREEFPELDVTVRGAISIARRLQDPLSELVKIEPKSIGVGQYQHDVNQGKLKKTLHEVVESCVNQVGVDLNTASTSLLQYVSGIGPAIAQNLVKYRKDHGLFHDRQDLLKVPSFSSKVFEQAAGFLRIPDGKVVLDRTGIHPERYQAVKEMAHELGVNISQLIGEGAKKITVARDKWTQLVGEYTFDDILKELEKPGRDPRDPFKLFQFREDIHEVKDLKPGMICPGIVTNVTNFGAFVDIGVHQDGLAHISELSDKFIDDPKKVASPGDQISVRVLAVDLGKNQISLSFKLEDKPRVVEPKEKVQRQPREKKAGGGPRPPRPEGEPRSAGHKPREAGQGGRPQQARGDRPQGERGARPQHQQGKGSGGHRPHQGQRPGGQGAGGGKPREPKKPFNNPFAALQNLKSE